MNYIIWISLLPLCLFCADYEICITSIFQNEARFLKEWIEFHKLIGVDHFYLYNNESTDEYFEVLETYINDNLVELYDFPNLWPDTHFAFGCQAYAYQHALLLAKGQTKWLAVIDVDEFIVPLDEFSLKDTLDLYYDDFSGVCIHWQNFGTSNIDFINPQELMIENLVMKAEKYSPHNSWYKTIFKVKDIETIGNPHYPKYRKGKYPVNTEGKKDFEESKVAIRHLQINHYWTRDEYHLHNVKLERYLRWNWPYDAILDKANQLNAIEDRSIQKYVPYLSR